jgi:hypothetical protein
VDPVYSDEILTCFSVAALVRNRRAVSVVTVAALMAVAALAAITFNESAERTELIYRSSLDNTQNPAAGSGKGGWSSGDAQVSYGSSQLDDTYNGENSDAPGIPCKNSLMVASASIDCL